MATRKKTTEVVHETDTNPDPITGEAGAHPVATGVGAAMGGIAAGAAAGSVVGPVGTAVGAIVGGVIGGLAGKGVGEMIDPTETDTYYRDTFETKDYVSKGDTFEHYQPAYRHGATVRDRYVDRSYDEVETDIRTDWEKSEHAKTLPYERARPAIRDAYDRVMELREEEMNVTTTPRTTGEVKVRKEVVHETKRIDVPVSHEEVVIERKSVNKRGVGTLGDVQEAEIRIPVTEEEIHVTKTPVVKEEVSVKKKKVTETKSVTGTVKKERLKVDDDSHAVVDE